MNAYTPIGGRPAAGPDRRGDRLLRLHDVMARTSLSRTTIYERIGKGTFPRPIELGCRRVAWYESDVDAFIAAPAVYRAA